MLKPFPHNKLWFIAGLMYLAVILFISLIPLNDVPLPSFNGIDKVEHFIAYLIAASYFLQIIQPGYLKRLGFTLILYGVFIECLQPLTTYRLFEGWDILANTLGVLSGILLTRKYQLPYIRRHL